MILKLLNHNVKQQDHQPKKRALYPGNGNRRQGGHYRPEYRDYLKDSGKDCEQNRVFYVQNSKPQKHHDSHKNAQKHLPLKPAAYFSLGTLPEIQYIFFVFQRSNNTQKILYPMLLHRKVKRNDY